MQSSAKALPRAIVHVTRSWPDVRHILTRFRQAAVGLAILAAVAGGCYGLFRFGIAFKNTFHSLMHHQQERFRAECERADGEMYMTRDSRGGPVCECWRHGKRIAERGLGL